MSEQAPEADQHTLRLMVVDVEDLAVVSAHLQDAEVTPTDMTYLERTKRFVLVVSRLDRTNAAAGRLERCQTGLHFERVMRVARRGFDPSASGQPLQLLAISFLPDDPPAGFVLLTFAGGSQIRLDVECLEAGMSDLGPRWPASRLPGHPLDDVPAKV